MICAGVKVQEMGLKRQRGMGLLEASIAAILISLLIVIFFSRVLSVSVAMERESMQLTVNQLGSALNIEALTLVVKEEQAELKKRIGMNPMILLDNQPLHYKGSFTYLDAMDISPGSWFFDETNNWLIYRINHVDQFGGGRAVPERVRFQVVADYIDENNNRIHDVEEKIIGLRFKALDEYHWQADYSEAIN